MRKFVTPADPAATIPDPERGRDLPAEGAAVAWTAYWAGLVARGDVTAAELVDAAAPPGPVAAAAEPDASPAAEA